MPGAGIIFAATGQSYNILARRAALSLRRAMPEIPIDLYTEMPGFHAGRPPVFDAVHKVETRWFRPKMEALRRSRFSRTLYLDCDVIVLTDLGDVFEILEHYDIALCQEAARMSRPARTPYGPALPNAFSSFNSGVVGLRAGDAAQRLMHEWETRTRESESRFDQPILRQLMYRSELRVHVLSEDYNFMHPRSLPGRPDNMSAPRILHLPRLYREKRFLQHPDAAYDVQSVLGYDQARALDRLIRNDVTYPGYPNMPIWSGPRPRSVERLLAWSPKWLRSRILARFDPPAFDS
ncbi:MAG: putative nucleotide-diphospho-sugar transferase [Rhodosalinus sp.]|uniref:putative nucleotide-diphospho-sugar transferase n=1 Tax=Rhodosalinus sp. TaxID=2047741 RepID=UPI00397D828B